MGIFALVCGVFGLPFMVAATVRSVAHVSALTCFSRSQAPGVKPKLEGVHEQRLTNLAVHVMIGMLHVIVHVMMTKSLILLYIHYT